MERKISKSLIIAFMFYCFTPMLAYSTEDLPTDLVLSDETISSGEVRDYRATNSITSGPAYTVESGADVTFKAGNIITLEPGFTASEGSIFHAAIPDDDLDGDGYVIASDCNDNNSSIHPGATETPYDGIDQDCDGSDLVDVDGDGYVAVQVGGDDCNDNDATINPAAIDIPENGIDEDCDGQDAVAPNNDNDGDGYTENQGDCDDADALINPDATEIAYNGKDDDCNPATPDDDLDGDGYVNADDCNDNDSNEHPNQMWYKDVDGDGYSDGTTDTTSCTRPGGYKTNAELTTTSGDCSDNDATINPGVQEVCDGVDNNCDGQIDEPVILFTSPVDGSTINLSSTLITGTINTCSQEVGILVNGVLAMMAGNEFAANDVPLGIGVNTLTAVATDEDGRTATDTITVYTNMYQDQVNLSANITSGISPLNVEFSIDTQISNPITTYEMDFEGDGVIDQTIVDPDNVPFTYVQEGLYYPTITVTDDQGYQYTDTIAINVLSLIEMDNLFKAKWNDMKTAMINADVERTVESFEVNSREFYSEQFTAFSTILNLIGTELGYLQLVAIEDNRAEYEIIVTRDGSTYSFYLLFVKDIDGIWRIRVF